MISRLILTMLLSTACLHASSADARRNTWTDRTLPPGIDRETFAEQDEQYRALDPSLKKPARKAVAYTVGSREEFWTSSADSWYRITAECRAVTSKAYVFVAIGDNYGNPVLWAGPEGYVTSQDAWDIGEEFTGIHDTVTRVFGRDPDTGVDGDVRLTLLLLDIDDSFGLADTGGVYTAGYFSPVDTWTESRAALYGYHSNERKIIYIDTYPAIEDSEIPDTVHDIAAAYPVIAHEMAHLVHYYHDPGEDIWFDEGCASLAEYVCGYGLREPSNFSLDSNDPLLTWNYDLSDYEQTALFLLYLYEHYGGEYMIRDIVNDEHPSVESIDSWLEAHAYYERFYDIFDTWIIANYLDDTSIYGGRYGYEGIDISATPFIPVAEHDSYHIYNTIYVRAGAGVYTRMTDGRALNIHCEHGRDLPGTVIVRGNGSTGFVTAGSAGIGCGSFAEPGTELILVTASHEQSSHVTYYTSPYDPGEPNNTTETATAVRLIDGYWLSGELFLSENGDRDWYAFTIDEGTLATVRCRVTSGIDIRFKLQYGDSLLVLRDEEFAGTSEAIVNYPLEATGTYFVGVGTWETMGKRADGASTGGSYSLEINLHRWAQADTGTPLGTTVSGDPAIGGDGRMTSVTGPDGDSVTCFDTAGEILWSVDITGAIAPPVVNEYGMTYVCARDGTLYAIDTVGTIQWADTIGDECTGSPAVDGRGVIYVPSAGSLHAVEPGGERLWTFSAGVSVRFTAPAVSPDGTVYCGGDDRGVYAINDNGSLVWRYEAAGSIDTGPALDENGVVYAGADDGGLYVLNPDGTLNWKYHTMGAINGSPVISDNRRVYVTSWESRHIHAFTTDGAKLWTYEPESTVASPLVLSGDGCVIFGTGDGTVQALEPSGSVAWKYNGQSTVHASPVIGEDKEITVVNSVGVMYKIAVDGGGSGQHPWPTAARNDSRTGSPASSFVNIPPEIITAGLPQVVPFFPYVAPVMVSDPDTLRGDRSILTMADGPGWLAADNYGRLTGLYEGDIYGIDAITLIATDLAGASDTLLTTIAYPEPLAAPENLRVSDVPEDNGHHLSLNWEHSPDTASGIVTHYRVYRSRVPDLGAVMPQSGFDSLESLIAWEQTATVLVDSVTAEQTVYVDTVPLTGVPYYFWIQAIGERSASKPAGSFLETAVGTHPRSLTVDRPVPNPFNSATTIRFTLPSRLKVTCALYTVTGQIAARLVDRMMAAGTHTVLIPGDGLSSGVYLVGLNIGSMTYACKVTHVK